MVSIQKNDFSRYVDNIQKLHIHKNVSGTEKNDRNIFIRDFLEVLGYPLENILDDVSQKGNGVCKIPDIRIFENEEERNKNIQSQFVIETKQFGSLKESLDNIDYLQLKRYITLNISKIRLICVTDYVSLFVFNATNIKKENKLKISNIDYINKLEEKNVKSNLYFQANLLNIDNQTLTYIKKIAYESVFQKLTFINPQHFEDTLNIGSYNVRKNFIEELFYIVEEIELDIRLSFKNKIDEFIESMDCECDSDNYGENFNNALNNRESFNEPVKSFILWGIRMNYLNKNMFLSSNEIDLNKVKTYLKNNSYKESFLLTSVYNIINKTFFLRAIEDVSTENTKFIKKGYNNRYLSNGILNEKANQGKENLVDYLKNIYEFKKEDLKPYSFVLKKDIYTWVIYEVSMENLIKLIKVFNNVNFKQLNQDILGDIYEHYLDNKKRENGKSQRELLGQFYTSKPLVRFMWNLTREVQRCIHNRDLYEKDKAMLDIIDIAYGSGTFLCEAILQINKIASNKNISSSGIVYSYMKDRNKDRKIEDHIYGFEINPLSNSIADINMFFSLIQLYGIENNNLKKYPIKNLKLFRTNSYDIQENYQINNKKPIQIYFDKQLCDTIQEREDILESKKKKYDIVIFNPPYGHIKPNDFMKNSLIPFAYAKYNFDNYSNLKKFSWKNIKEGKVPEKELNKGKLRDNYAFFFGISDKILKDKGIMAFITSNSYLTIPTYKWYRKYILENYTIHYIINFNNISERKNSMFAPEAAIATAIMIISKQVPKKNNKIKYLDCSQNNSVLEKYKVFAELTKYNQTIDNKNSIEEFQIKSLEKIKFKEYEQEYFHEKEDYVLQISDSDSFISNYEERSVNLSSYGNLNAGIGPGDVKLLVDRDKNKLKEKIENIVFKGEVEPLTATAKRFIKKNLEKGNIDKIYDENKCTKFVLQKNMNRYYYNQFKYIYHDKYILWRSRINDCSNNPIKEKYKLCLREMREKKQIHSFVTDELILPQDGGRFNYLVRNENLSLHDMYILAALINSKVGQLYYEKIGVGIKDIKVADLTLFDEKNKNELYNFSKELHYIYSDYNSLKNKSYGFKSKYFEDNIKNRLSSYILIRNCKYWKVVYQCGLYIDLYVREAKLENKVIKLNSHVSIEAISKEYAEKIYMKYLKNYEGDLNLSQLVINEIDLFNEEEKEGIINNIEKKIKLLEDEIDRIAFKVYGLHKKADI